MSIILAAEAVLWYTLIWPRQLLAFPKEKKPKTYDIDYFIAKFEAIPYDRWLTFKFTDYRGRHCALGHCGARIMRSTEEARALVKVLPDTAYINDYPDPFGHPKDRILKALRDTKTGVPI